MSGNRGVALLLVLWALVLLGRSPWDSPGRCGPRRWRRGTGSTRRAPTSRRGRGESRRHAGWRPCRRTTCWRRRSRGGRRRGVRGRVESESGKVDVNLERRRPPGDPQERDFRTKRRKACGTRSSTGKTGRHPEAARGGSPEYGRMQEPVTPRNGKIRSVEELSFVKGVTKEFFRVFLSKVFTAMGTPRRSLPAGAGDRPAVAPRGVGRGGGTDRRGPRGGAADLGRGPLAMVDEGRLTAQGLASSPGRRRRTSTRSRPSGGRGRRDPRRAVLVEVSVRWKRR